MKIYIVRGDTGEYDDYRDWLVKGFYSQNVAFDLCEKLNKASKAGNFAWNSNEFKQSLIEAGDPSPSIDYNGVTYSYQELEIE